MLAEPYDAILLDLDGVIYRGSRAIPGAAGSLATLRSRGKRLAFVTNNSSRTPQAIATQLVEGGIPADAREVQTSADATAAFLSARGTGSAYVVGEGGIRSALAGAGIVVAEGEPEGVEVVVVGFDRGVDYARLRTATRLVLAGAALVATNADASFPAADGTQWPGAGALLAVIETASGHRAEVIGKPHPPLLIAALERAGGGRPLVVGDRLDTDIAGASGLGWDSALVLTGISTRSQVDASPWQPTFVLDDLRGLVSGD